MDLSLREIAKLIDHALLAPAMTDAEIRAGCLLCRECGVAAACVKPYAIPLAREVLDGSDVVVCPVIAFPHGISATTIKAKEAEEAARAGGAEIDMVINTGKAVGGDWAYVSAEIKAVHDACLANRAILKVIFETDFLQDTHIIRLCEICSEIGVAFVKTSTGFGFVRQANGFYNYTGATIPHLQLMRKHSAPSVKIKASGGIRSLDELLAARAAGADRIGTSSTKAILAETRQRGIG